MLLSLKLEESLFEPLTLSIFFLPYPSLCFSLCSSAYPSYFLKILLEAAILLLCAVEGWLDTDPGVKAAVLGGFGGKLLGFLAGGRGGDKTLFKALVL